MKKTFIALLSFLLVIQTIEITLTAEELSPPTYTEASVHDPSVIFTNNEYYVFGSHLAAAKTPDLMNWEQIEGDGVNPANSLFEDVTEELEEALTWAQTDTLWAPDVIQLEADGRYYMYYNACEGSSPRSAMGIAVSDNVEGPYEDLGLILRSGMTEEESASIDGTPYDEQHYPEVYDATNHPNVVDPDVFYDKEGKLWMVYGSYSGGIYILELDPETGIPFEGQGYGEKLLGGNHSRIEAPYIVYHEETDYYYLYLSYGGLDAVGGYNVRVARSENPNGPYYDIQGNHMLDVKGREGTFFDDESIAPTGTKIIGNHLFEKNFGEPGSETGYVSPGHNSVFVDPETGEQFLIFHTRFPNRGEIHEIRVHQMFMNEDGWPVVAPFRYSKETLAEPNVDEVAGAYKFISFTSAIGEHMDRSVIIQLNEDGSISGEVEGFWQLNGSNIVVTVDDQQYKGVVIKQWDPVAEKETITFSALAENGLSIWGTRTEISGFSDQDIVDMVAASLTIGDTSQVMGDLQLLTEGDEGSTILWESSNPEVVSNKGTVQRPNRGEEPEELRLTATVTKGNAVATRTFDITVIPETYRGLVAHYSFENDLSDEAGNVGNGTITGDRLHNEGGEITFEEGKVGQAAKFNGESGIRLPDGLIDSFEYSVALWLKPEAFNSYTPSFFGASAENSWVSLLPNGFGSQTMLWSGEQWYDGETGIQIPLNEWSHVVFTVDRGDLSIYIDGAKVTEMSDFPNVFNTLEASFGLGVNYWDLPYQGLIDELYIYNNQVLTEDQIENYWNNGSFSLDTSELEQLLESARSLVNDDKYTMESRNELSKVMESIQEMMADFSSWREIEDAKQKLETAIQQLEVADDGNGGKKPIDPREPSSDVVTEQEVNDEDLAEEHENYLPDTATNMFNWLVVSALLLVIGGGLYIRSVTKQ
ncbi:family 43 glycosylhydrolase [Gracilibacillus sp. HCP3S3_G5_1]|uniref:family 43 glycosylhydrolase n=1 Tax=unclassified Gracilibacillus TaxID=2625209 RepID=UPI003F8B2AF7